MQLQPRRGKRRHRPAVAAAAAAAAAAPPPAEGAAAAEPVRLSVPGGFSWETTPWPEVAPLPARADESSSDNEDDTQTPPASRLSRRELRLRAAAEERQLAERERLMMDPSRAPETADDHERLVVAQPDDSSLWIRFMSHFLQATEIEKARGVARRALNTINFRQEDEKLNVYVAWLNLENMHGTQETLNNVLHEALQSNDTFKVYTRMAEIHAANSKHDEAEEMYSQLVRKMAANKDSWLRYGTFLMQVDRHDAARALMQRALRGLDRRHHVEVISKFAQLEFRFGQPERGKTMFDHLLSTYPKRLDQWNVYVNQLIKTSDYDAARQIFQRATTVRLSARRMRSLLKRFLEFEQAHGSVAQQEAVRETARQFVESRSEADAMLLETER
ncbi:protein RRP5 homolog [Pollicipes pollicipes]|uniref:protein RRP5 homolog n=1 Tax=Pollicipes pollicipes TaxID=41117 RepID=UPI0018857292|nr:protein RRP5 homolog [Pollicipes pollicipes]XP_037090379.1 protein RRP5 homolog [Pollicipes pollicipes]